MSTMYIRNFRTLYVTRINIRIIIACIPNLDGLSGNYSVREKYTFAPGYGREQRRKKTFYQKEAYNTSLS